MGDQEVERLRAHRNSIQRYRRLLATYLTSHERAYIERRLIEEKASLKALLDETMPERFGATTRWVAGGPRTSLNIDRLLNPADAFGQPIDVVEDCDLTTYEKRAILSAWAARACALDEEDHNGDLFDAIVDALSALGEGASAATSQRHRSLASESRSHSSP